MSKKLITLGTPTSTGGKVITSSSSMVVNGQKVTLVGDIATCLCGNKSCRGQGIIMKGSSREILNDGVMFAYEHDPVDTGCGNCFVLSSPHQVQLGGVTGQSINIGGNGAGISFGNGVNLNIVPINGNSIPTMAQSSSSSTIPSNLKNADTQLQQNIQSIRNQYINPEVKKIFCKSCLIPKGKIDAGKTHEPVSNFGELAILKNTEENRSGGSLDAVSTSGLLVAAGATEAIKLNLSQLGSMSVSVGGVVSRIPWLGLFIPSQLGDGTLADSQYLQGVGSIETRVKFRFVTDANGKKFVTGYHVGDGMTGYGDPVKVVNVEEVSAGLAKSYIADLGDGIKITWYPEEQDKTPFNLPRPHTDDIDPSTILVRPIESDEIRTTVYPEEELQELILTFPADSGISPLYVVFNAKARYESGVVTGQGKDVEWTDGYWLGEASNKGQGQYIPTQVADALRGREFKTFSGLQTAFWKEVAKHPELLIQFDKRNINQIKQGNAPWSKREWQSKTGKRGKYEIHHVELISQGGDVYNIDNLRITTVKNHIRIHSNEK
ncbi:TPA: S-type pyocin domain-containing protein [Photobacterium damselae]